MNNGVWEVFRINDPLLLDVLKKKQVDPKMWKTLVRMTKNIKSKGITMTPEFAIKNFIRDTITLNITDPALNIETGWNPDRKIAG